MPKKSLYIPKKVLIHASGIDKKIVDADIKNNILKMDENGYIWYREAAQYVCKKWADGKIEMYDPNGEEPDKNFSSRVLSILDDQIAENKLTLSWGSSKK